MARMSVLSGSTRLNVDLVLTVVAFAVLMAAVTEPALAGCGTFGTTGTGGATGIVSWLMSKPLAVAGALAVVIAIIIGLFSPGDLGNHIKNALVTLLVVFVAGTLVSMVISAANGGVTTACSGFST